MSPQLCCPAPLIGDVDGCVAAVGIARPGSNPAVQVHPRARHGTGYRDGFTVLRWGAVTACGEPVAESDGRDITRFGIP